MSCLIVSLTIKLMEDECWCFLKLSIKCCGWMRWTVLWLLGIYLLSLLGFISFLESDLSSSRSPSRYRMTSMISFLLIFHYTPLICGRIWSHTEVVSTKVNNNTIDEVVVLARHLENVSFSFALLLEIDLCSLACYDYEFSYLFSSFYFPIWKILRAQPSN